jgi:hypothetical protein
VLNRVSGEGSGLAALNGDEDPLRAPVILPEARRKGGEPALKGDGVRE